MPLEAAENRALHRADISVLAQREWLRILDCGLGEHSWSRPTMRPRRPMDEERMAYVHVSGATRCVGAHASERRGGELAGDVTVPDATLTKRCEDAGDVQVRSHENFGGCVLIAHVLDQRDARPHDTWGYGTSYRHESVRKKLVNRCCHGS